MKVSELKLLFEKQLILQEATTTTTTTAASLNSTPKPPPTTPKPLILSQPPIDSIQIPHQKSKYSHIKSEILSSELTFINDMQLLYSTFILPNIIPPNDTKIIFSNLQTIIHTSNSFYSDLLLHSDTDSLGLAFIIHSNHILHAYSDYCKNQESSLSKISEYSSNDSNTPQHIRNFLLECQSQIQGKTGAWDLGSLVIKPVQRVLKYPLLLKELLRETDTSHPDYNNISQAFETFESMAETINEIKKRKDIIDKYVDGKNSVNVIHGISKKLTRGTQQFKLAAGLANQQDKDTADEFYDELILLFDNQFKGLNLIEKHLQAWINSLQEYLDIQYSFAEALEAVYMARSDDSINSISLPMQMDIIKEYKLICQRNSSDTCKIAQNDIRITIRPIILNLLSIYKDPLIIIKKRDNKKLDYMRVMGLKAKGDQIDKALQESADTYVSLHAQLIEELPTFISVIKEVTELLVVKIANIQKTAYQSIIQGHKKLGINTFDVIANYKSFFAPESPLEIATRNLKLLRNLRFEVFIMDEFYDNKSESTINSHIKNNPFNNSDQLIDFSSSPRHSVSSNNSQGDFSKGAHFMRTANSPLKPAKPSNLAMMPTKPEKPSNLSSQISFGDFTSSRPISSPSKPPKPIFSDLIMFEVVVIYPFKAETTDEISLNLGDCVVVTKESGRGNDVFDNSWWYGEHVKTNRFGWFPSNFVQRR